MNTENKVRELQLMKQFLQDANTIQITSDTKASKIHWYALHLYLRLEQKRLCQALFTNYVDAERLKRYFEKEHPDCKCMYERI